MDQYVKTNGIQLHYLDHPGDEPALILLPGLTANAHSFDGLIQAGLSPRFHVLAVDLRGRGLSDKPESGYSMADHAVDIVGLLDALEIEQTVVGGHSYGAFLTFYLAANYPARVAKLILIDIAKEAADPSVRELIKPSLDRLGRVLPSWEAYKAEMQQMPYLGGYWDSALESFFRADMQINDDGTVQARTKAEAIVEAMDGVIAEPWADHIAAVRQPSILINAPGPIAGPGTPPIMPAEQAQATAASMADCSYVQVPGNHYTMIFGDNAPALVETITDFVRGE